MSNPSDTLEDRMAARRASSRHAAGFTLIEILVALAIIAVALSAVVAETAQHISSTIHMRDRTLAHWVAMDRVTELHAAGAWPSTGTSSGTTLMADREWFWTMTVSSTPDEGIRRVDVDVRAEQAAERSNASAIAYVERPQQ